MTDRDQNLQQDSRATETWPVRASHSLSGEIDAWVDGHAGVRQAPVAVHASSERAGIVGRLLGMLGLGFGSPSTHSEEGANKSALVEATLARILSDRRSNTSTTEHVDDRSGEVLLTPRDEEAVDALVASSMDPSRVPGSLRDRAVKAAGLGELLTGGMATSQIERARTTERVMAALTRERAMGAAAPLHSARVSRGWRWSDLISMAAVLLLGTAVLWPTIAGVRAHGNRMSCQGTLASAGGALAGYAGDFKDVLPVASMFQGGLPWWDVGVPKRSNSSNLFTLASQGYTSVKGLSCAGNALAATSANDVLKDDWRSLDQISYSYRVMDRPTRYNASKGSPSHLVIMSDRSPVVLRAIRGEVIFPLENSPNHDGKGQAALMGDGSVRWMETPVMSDGDNIWLPGSIERVLKAVESKLSGRKAEPISGTETPASADDDFVGP